MFCKYFLPFFLFILLTVSFIKQKFLILVKSNLPFSLSRIMLLASYLETLHQTHNHLDFLLLHSRSYIVSCFTFKSNINLFFVKRISCVSGFIFLHMDVQYQHHLLKRLSFLHWVVFTPLSMISWLHLCGSMSGFSVLLHLSICLSFHQCHGVLIAV